MNAVRSHDLDTTCNKRKLRGTQLSLIMQGLNVKYTGISGISVDLHVVTDFAFSFIHVMLRLLVLIT